MKKTSLFLLALSITVTQNLAYADEVKNFIQPDIFINADISAGKLLLSKNCIHCHAASYGGDGSSIYTREYRKVQTAKGLLAQVRSCNTMLGLKWFDDEELNVAAYLNNAYYQFKP